MQVWIRRFALLLLPLGFLAVMVAAPLLSLAFYDGEGAWAEVVADDYMRLRLGWTVAQAVLTCVLVTALGVPAAWVLARMDFAGRHTVLRLLMLPFVMPTLVVGVGVLSRSSETFAKFLFPDGRNLNKDFRLFLFQISTDSTQIPP